MKYQNVFVVTTKRLAKLYKTLPSLIMLNFLEYRDEFEEGKHFFVLVDEELETFRKKYPEETGQEELYLWTEGGMYRHAEILAGFDAWRAYCQLIYHHFKQSEEINQAIRT